MRHYTEVQAIQGGKKMRLAMMQGVGVAEIGGTAFWPEKMPSWQQMVPGIRLMTEAL